MRAALLSRVRKQAVCQESYPKNWKANMTIEIKPEDTRIIDEAIQAGLIHRPDDVVDLGVETLRSRLQSLRVDRNIDATGSRHAHAGIWRRVPAQPRRAYHARSSA